MTPATHHPLSRALALCVLLFSCESNEALQNQEAATEWILKAFSSGDAWTESPPKFVSFRLGSKERVFRGSDIEKVHAAFAQTLVSATDHDVRKFGQRQKKVGALSIGYDRTAIKFPIYETIDHAGLFAVLVSDNTAPTSTLLYFNDTSFDIRKLLE